MVQQKVKGITIVDYLYKNIFHLEKSSYYKYDLPLPPEKIEKEKTNKKLLLTLNSYIFISPITRTRRWRRCSQFSNNKDETYHNFYTDKSCPLKKEPNTLPM